LSAGSQERELLLGLERRVLANGMGVVVLEDHRLPTVTALLAYRVGSSVEREGMTGMAHFFEHMVFKGTAKYKRGDIDLVTLRCGGENNAFTTHDLTAYWFHVHSKHLDQILDILADTMGNCTLDQKEFDLERGPVLQEMNIWLDGPWGQLEREVEKTVYRKSGYRHPVLGWREDVEHLTRDRLKEFYISHYQPNNASLVVVGDVKKEDVFARSEHFFGSIPRGKDVAEPASREPSQKEERQVEVKTDKTADRIIMAFRGDTAGSDNDILLDVVATILGDGRLSRLRQRLVHKEKLAGEGNVEVSNESRKQEGLFTVQVELALGASLEETRKAILEEIEAMRQKPVSPAELMRAKNILRARFAFDTESQVELVSKLGYFEAFGLPRYVPDYMVRVNAITAEQIQACARRFLTEENRTIGVGHAQAKRSGGAPRRAHRPGGRAARRLQAAPPAFGDVKEVMLDNGLTVLVKQRRDVPVLVVQAFVNAGTLYEPEDKAGVASLTGDMLNEGVDDGKGRVLSGDDLAEIIENVGGKFTTSATGGAVKVLSEHAPLAYDAVRDVLRYPSFPADRFDKLRDDMLAEIESENDDPQQVARRLFFEAAYKGHPFHRPSFGYKETVEKLKRDDVVAYYRRLFRPENVIIAVAGDLDPDRAVQEIRSRFGDWKGEGEWTPLRPPQPVKQKEPRTVYSFTPSQQVRFQLGHVGIDRTNPDYFVLRVTETILCSSPGFTNRLAKDVRDEQGLAYDVSGTLTGGAGIVAGPFQVVLGVEAKDKDKGLATVMEELRKFIHEGPTAQETEDARQYLLDSFVNTWETTEDLAAYMLEVRRYDLGADYPAQFFRAVSKVTPAAVKQAAAKYIDLKNLTLVGVGPVDKDGKLKEGDKDK
jgi:zinc protease